MIFTQGGTKAGVTCGALVLGASLLLGVTGVEWAPGPSAAHADSGDSEMLDRVVLRSGRVVTGRILEQDDRQIRVMVMISGIEAPATYSMSEVLKVERGVVAPEGGEAESDDEFEDEDAARDRRSGDGPLVYRLELDGMLVAGQPLQGFPQRPVITPSTLEEALEDAASYDPEAVIVEFNAVASGGLNGVLLIETYGAVVEPFIDDGLNIVFWVEEAQGGASLLPFSAPTIYFKPDGRMGGLSGVGEIESGDEWVNKKLLSAALGHAVGMAIKGGYAPEIIRAMCVESNWLAVRFDSGRPEYIEHEPRDSDGEGWIVLSDNGEGEYADDEEKLEANDVLTLDADWAYRLGVSRGDFDRFDDLVWELGIDDDYVVERGKGTRILETAAERVERAIDSLIRIQQELEDLGNDQIGRRLNAMKRMKSLLAANSEVLDPSGNQRATIDIQIERIQEAMRQANNRRRR